MQKKNDIPCRIFIVEDDPLMKRLIRHVMELDPEHEVFIFDTGKDCLDNLHLNPHLISLDYKLPDMDGLEVLRNIKKHNPAIHVIVLSGQQEIEIAVKMLKEGASDYITKETSVKERLANSVKLLKRNLDLEKQVDELQQELSVKYSSKEIVGLSKPIQDVIELTQKAAKSNITVSITGETGTGKEVIAKSIHYHSNRNKNNFVAINMAAIPSELLESELFGHEKGAFTGALSGKIGKFELANGGTLFLDEISEMDLFLQAKILRALQEKEITRVGGTKTIKFDARIITATHRNLADLVKEGKFRQDLYYRLLGLSIEIAPLRKRGTDIILLANHFLRLYSNENKTPLQSLSQKTKDALLNYYFPGNVRELKSIIDLACVLADGGQIKREHLQFQAEELFTNPIVQEMPIKDYTEKVVDYCLKKYDNNVNAVAEKLGISKSTVYKISNSMKK